jgi:glutathione S-transferase
MTLEVYWGSGSPFAWRVLLTLEIKRLPYVSHLLEFSKQEHKTPEFLKLNPRGKVPVLRDGDFVVYESLAVMKYLDDKHPEPPLFGRNPEEAARINLAICECTSYIETPVVDIVRPIFSGGVNDKRDAIQSAAANLREEFALLNARLSHGGPWLMGVRISAADIALYPQVAILLRALGKEAAAGLDLKLAPLMDHFPELARWMRAVESLPGYGNTYPPHWR